MVKQIEDKKLFALANLYIAIGWLVNTRHPPYLSEGDKSNISKYPIVVVSTRTSFY